MIRIAQISDVHFGAEDQNALDQATAHIRRENYDLIAVCGDLTQRGKRTEFESAAAWLSKLPGEKLVVPGNHDTPLLDLAARVTKPFQRFEETFGSLAGPSRSGQVATYGMNTARGWQARRNWAEGSVNLRALGDIITDITQNADQSAHAVSILMAHHPFIEPPGSPLKTVTQRGKEASRLLQAGPINLFLYGHIHVPIGQVWSSEHGAYLGVSTGTLSVRLRGERPSFNSIDIDETRIHVRTHKIIDAEIDTQTLGCWTIDTLAPVSI